MKAFMIKNPRMWVLDVVFGVLFVLQCPYWSEASSGETKTSLVSLPSSRSCLISLPLGGSSWVDLSPYLASCFARFPCC
eukprot:m.275750 g.275750  ORF g.275750 m.275750 type:complete len:79 (+) comp40604_c0_seq2:484-720(+)